MSRRVNIITAIVTLLIIAGWYFGLISFNYIIPVLLIYLTCNIIGATVINLNYFVRSTCSIDTSEKKIAISFDDGPHPEITPKLLSLLDKYNVVATYFCVGRHVADNRDIAADIISKGHIIGNHSFSHSGYFDLFSSAKMHNEIVDTNDIIERATGVKPRFFRPPYGVTNPMLGRAIRKAGMKSIGWSLRSFDTVLKTDKVISKLINHTKPGDIVLFHDTQSEIISIIESYLIWLENNDYKVVSLDSLIEESAYEN